MVGRTAADDPGANDYHIGRLLHRAFPCDSGIVCFKSMLVFVRYFIERTHLRVSLSQCQDVELELRSNALCRRDLRCEARTDESSGQAIPYTNNVYPP